ncbi:MAG TPA: molybdenum cofactor biosynthesis protein MoaE [Solirubrobacterales bacterium]|nr:molybdenum cofactor biosynthesis protein MoaE [Solirubrobacterales bacterium]
MARSMTVRVRLFAVLRQRAGRGSVDVALQEGATVADALTALSREPGLADVLARVPVRMAVNRDYAEPETVLSPDDELALVPPVSGGESERVRVGPDPISLEEVAGRVIDPAAGAVVTFQGFPREVPQLEYEAYGEMAEERMAAILGDCIERHGLTAAAAEHRTGPVPAGEASVLVAASAPHRPEAFAGAREAIDRIKAEAPIWKLQAEAER